VSRIIRLELESYDKHYNKVEETWRTDDSSVYIPKDYYKKSYMSCHFEKHDDDKKDY